MEIEILAVSPQLTKFCMDNITIYQFAYSTL